MLDKVANVGALRLTTCPFAGPVAVQRVVLGEAAVVVVQVEMGGQRLMAILQRRLQGRHC